MDITPELIVAAGSLIAALVAARQAHFSAKKDLVAQLQDQLLRDQDRIAKLETDRNACADERIELETDRNLLRDELTKLQRRATDTETRLAQSERRAGEAETQANSFRRDVIRIGEELSAEREEHARALSDMKRDHQDAINKLVLIIENLINKIKSSTGQDSDIDLDALKRMYIVSK